MKKYFFFGLGFCIPAVLLPVISLESCGTEPASDDKDSKTYVYPSHQKCLTTLITNCYYPDIAWNGS